VPRTQAHYSPRHKAPITRPLLSIAGESRIVTLLCGVVPDQVLVRGAEANDNSAA
jgi:hypothetical protein